MADIRQAIEYAKKDPESSFAKELRKRIESGQMDKELVSAGLKPMKPVEPNALERVVTGIQEKGAEVADIITDPTKTPLEAGIGATAKAFSAISSTAYNALPDTLRTGLDKIAGGIGKGFDYLTDKIASSEFLQEAVQGDTSKLQSALKIASDLGIISGELLGTQGAVKTGELVQKGALKTGEKIVDVAKQIPEKARQALQAPKEKLIEFIAPEADDFTKTILKETTPDEVDNYLRIQEKASVDPRSLTPYEIVGDKIADATKKLEAMKNEIGAKKAQFVEPLRGGLEIFETKGFVDDLVSLKNKTSSDLKGFVQDIIDEAKNLKTKGGVDKFIDNIQDKIYRSGKDLTLPKGSALEKQLRGILGKMNNELKKTLPKEYSALNKQFSDLQKATTALNTALGETIEGVATRGGSLVKQFFSPSGRKAKELFDFIKTNTGIDLAKDATLARYVMELFDDPRARSLLGGEIPTSISGVINKVIDFGVEKTGVGKKLQETMREGAVRKAKQLTTTNTQKLP